MHRKVYYHKCELQTPHVGKADACCGKGRRLLWERPTLAVAFGNAAKEKRDSLLWAIPLRLVIVQGITYFTRIFLPLRM